MTVWRALPNLIKLGLNVSPFIMNSLHLSQLIRTANNSTTVTSTICKLTRSPQNLLFFSSSFSLHFISHRRPLPSAFIRRSDMFSWFRVSSSIHPLDVICTGWVVIWRPVMCCPHWFPHKQSHDLDIILCEVDNIVRARKQSVIRAFLQIQVFWSSILEDQRVSACRVALLGKWLQICAKLFLL